MSTPMVPPRPAARQAAPAEIEIPAQQPQIPPRPVAKARGTSPAGRAFAQSPFNEKWDPLQLTKTISKEPVRRPPSVSAMPGLGLEGYEYGEIQLQPQEPVSVLDTIAAAQTRSVAEDLKLHAPKPSLPKTAAVAQVQAVTRTDSHTAAAHGIGRPPSQDGEAFGRVRSRTSISRPDSAASDHRHRSVYEEGPADQGGFRVPINPLLGDVQAPSPVPPVLSPHHTGHSPQDGKPRRHQSISGKDLNPPGAYGLHGHGIQPTGNLERDWYSKHPRELEHEEVAGHGVYESIGSGRGAFALSSDDLNKLVRDTARGSGFGTSGNVTSYPDEQIGYQASEQYSIRRNSASLQKIPSNTPESPLRKASLPAFDAPSAELYRGSTSQDVPSGSDVEDVHIEPPVKKYNKVTGGEESMRETQDAKPYATHETEDDNEYRVPILAEDEVAKEVGQDHLQPAVSPAPRRNSAYDDAYRVGSPHGSRPSSRPGSIYGLHSAMHHNLQRYTSHHDDREHVHTPLEDVNEYEPLFPEGDDQKMMTSADRFKQRPDLARQRFPSQDIWEDTPDSAMYEATVSTPDLPAANVVTSTFESPEAERARKGEVSEEEKKKLIPAEDRLRMSRFAPHLRDDMPTRPGLQHRFPSQDVWEDSPDSHHLVATVNDSDQDDDNAAPPQPIVPQRPAKSRLGEGASSQQTEPSVPPSIPARPQDKVQSELAVTSAQPEPRRAPGIPERPKPQIPARPAKKEPEPVSKVQDDIDNVTSPPLPKTKPQVPARPAGGKIAGIKSSFMNDLNQKLGLGPPKEKEKEPEPEPAEAKPLEDARKSRARGPQRRAPPKVSNAPAKPSPLSFSMSMPQSVWSIDDQGSLNVAKAKLSKEKLAQMGSSTPADAPMAPIIDTTSGKEGNGHEEVTSETVLSAAPALSTNTAGESTDPVSVDTDALSKRSTEEIDQKSAGDPAVSTDSRKDSDIGSVSPKSVRPVQPSNNIVESALE